LTFLLWKVIDVEYEISWLKIKKSGISCTSGLWVHICSLDCFKFGLSFLSNDGKPKQEKEKKQLQTPFHFL
jgi:hypothetical protein